MVSNPGFDFNVSVSSRTVQRLLPSGLGPQANAASSVSWSRVYFTGCPGLGSSSMADSTPCSKYRFLVRQTVIRSTCKKSSISEVLLPLCSNSKILTRLYFLKLKFLPLFCASKKAISFLFNLIVVANCTIF